MGGNQSIHHKDIIKISRFRRNQRRKQMRAEGGEVEDMIVESLFRADRMQQKDSREIPFKRPKI